MIAAVIVMAILLIGLPAAALVLGPRLRPPKPRPRTGTGERAYHLARDATGPVAFEPPPGVSPAELGALAVPDAHYQQVTATLLDLAARGHLIIGLHTPPTNSSDIAWWTVDQQPGRDELRDYERILLHEVSTATDERFPNLNNRAVDRVVRALHGHIDLKQAGAAGALQHGIARQPDLVDASWFAHAAALDVSPTLTRSLTARHTPLPAWVTTHCVRPVTWALLERFTLDGSPLLPQNLHQAGFQGGI